IQSRDFVRFTSLILLALATARCGVAPRDYGSGVTTETITTGGALSGQSPGSAIEGFKSLVIDSQSYQQNIVPELNGISEFDLSPAQLAYFEANRQTTIQISG